MLFTGEFRSKNTHRSEMKEREQGTLHRATIRGLERPPTRDQADVNTKRDGVPGEHAFPLGPKTTGAEKESRKETGAVAGEVGRAWQSAAAREDEAEPGKPRRALRQE